MKKEAKNNAVGFKLPKKINVAGYEYKVVVVPDNTVYKDINTSGFLGRHCYSNKEILINEKAFSNWQNVKSVFFHELAHGLYYYCGAWDASNNEVVCQCSAVEWCKSFDLRGEDELEVPKRVWMNERWFSVSDKTGKFDGEEYEGIDYSKFMIKIGKPVNGYNWMQIFNLYPVWAGQFAAVLGLGKRWRDDSVFMHGLALRLMELFKFREG